MREIARINYLSIRDLDRAPAFRVAALRAPGRRCMMGSWPPSSTSMPIPMTRRPRPPGPWPGPPPRGTASWSCSRPTATTGRRRPTWPRVRASSIAAAARRRRPRPSLGLSRVAWLGYADSGMTGWEQTTTRAPSSSPTSTRPRAGCAQILTRRAPTSSSATTGTAATATPTTSRSTTSCTAARARGAAGPRVLESTMNRDLVRRMFEAARPRAWPTSAGIRTRPWMTATPSACPRRRSTCRSTSAPTCTSGVGAAGPCQPGHRHRGVPRHAGRRVRCSSAPSTTSSGAVSRVCAAGGSSRLRPAGRPSPRDGPSRLRRDDTGAAQKCLRASRLDRPESRSPSRHRLADPARVGARMLAQRPPDGLPDPERRVLEIRLDAGGQQLGVGLLLEGQLAEDGRAPQPTGRRPGPTRASAGRPRRGGAEGWRPPGRRRPGRRGPTRRRS